MSRGYFFIPLLFSLYLYTGMKLALAIHARKLNPFIWLGTLAYFFLMIGWQFSYRWHWLGMQSLGFKSWAWIGGVALGLWATFILISLPVDVVRIFSTLVYVVFSRKNIEPERRRFLENFVTLAIGGAASIFAGVGLAQVLYGPLLVRVTLRRKHLPPGLAGLKIAQISDLHVGPTIGTSYVAGVVDRILAEKPDLIVVTGDLADGTPETLRDRIEPLSRLKAPLGVFYVTGNHEYYWGGEEWVEEAKVLGFTPLMNENRVLEFNGTRFILGGITDVSAHQYFPSHASDPYLAAKTELKSAFKILLAHRPESVEGALEAGFDIQLSGHTHGGQFFPWSLYLPLAQKYRRGLHEVGNLSLYVNCGTGYWGPPNRFAIPSEITLVELAQG
jgi:predicted MPP superfamily phosphohydrolase